MEEIAEGGKMLGEKDEKVGEENADVKGGEDEK